MKIRIGNIVHACRISAVVLVALVSASTPALCQGGKAEHVVLISWDGLRPDMVTAERTPTLHALAQSGTFFNRHHAVYPSSTEVNGTALATGMYPAHSGIVGNREFRPDIKPDAAVAMESLEAIRKGDGLTGGKYLAVPTIYEILQSKGFRTVVAGTKPVALLADRSANRAEPGSVTLFEGKTLPPALLSRLESDYGKFPEKPTFPDAGQNTWTTDSLLGTLWKDGVPKLTLLWLSDPDFTQHNSQPGSPAALDALKVNDALLARLLKALEEKGVRDRTDVMVVSDHGFSTIDRSLDVASLLVKEGFSAFRKFLQQPRSGDILVVSNGGSVFFYVTNHDRETVEKLVRFLTGSDWCGTVFADGGWPGAFPLAAARINSPAAPDVVASLAWNRSANDSGVRGMICADSAGADRNGKGMHASLSPYDMHNTLVASGPDFRAGYVDELPSGNVDVAPTVLWLFGITPDGKMDGRVLREALVAPDRPAPPSEEKTLTAPSGAGQRYLKISSVEDTEYLDEGALEKKP